MKTAFVRLVVLSLSGLVASCHADALSVQPIARADSAPAQPLEAPVRPACQTNAPIPWSEIGARAGADYHGDGLAVSQMGEGARLHCVFQRLDGEATREGLWLTSTVTNAIDDRFRVTAAAVGRVTPCAPSPVSGAERRTRNIQHSTFNLNLDAPGQVTIAGQTVRFTRPGVLEEYSVSMDGVRQDFVVTEKPAGAGELQVRLAVSGAQVEQAPGGVKLVLAHSGRKIAYSRLRVTDASGRELPARMVVGGTGHWPVPSGDSPGGVAETFELKPVSLPRRGIAPVPFSGPPELPPATLAVVVNDVGAVYPVRIDPTFSDDNWVSLGGIRGVNTSVYAAVVDGSGDLYIGGSFTSAGNTNANHIAKWNGSSWTALGPGMNGDVRALAVSGSDVYAGGFFTMAGASAVNYIAKWNGSTWTALGSGMNNLVYALAVSGSDVYAGGDFTTAGGSAANRMAKWNGSSWSALGSGMLGPGFTISVRALAVSGSDVYAGGYFTSAGGIPANYIAKWNGSSWSEVGSGVDSPVLALAVSGSDVYAGGFFTTATNSGNVAVTANHIAKWNGSSWSALGSGRDMVVQALAISGGSVYAGGNFDQGIAKWNGSSWTALGSGMDLYVYAIAVSGSDVYAGGFFTTAGGNSANYVARWNGSSWTALGSGMNGQVVGLAVSGSNMYAVGEFSTAGAISANYIAKWNGSSWSALGSGMNNYTYALAVSGSDVYAGGGFTTAGGISASRIAKWNGSSWSALGLGLNGTVGAVAVSGSDVYAGGVFTTAGFGPANNVAKWNGSSWSALGSGLNGSVGALAVSGSDVYAGGFFTTAGGSPASYIAKWNGSSWSALGSGMNNWVSALAVSGSDVYAGGFFTTAGGSSADRVAKWNGSSWSALGSGVNSLVSALAVSGSDVYAGGQYTTAGGNPANYIAKWDGSSWSALGSGMNDPVNALAVSGRDMYAGGAFMTAGGKVSRYVAKVVLNNPPTVANLIPDQNFTYGYASNFTFAATTFSEPDAGQALSYTASGMPPGVTFDGPSRTFSGTPTVVGTSSVMITATDNGTPSLSTNDTFDIVVAKAPLVVTANNTNRPYGDTNPPLAGSLAGTVNGDIITASFVTTATMSSPPGSYPITPVLQDLGSRLGNYTVITNNGALTVNGVTLEFGLSGGSPSFCWPTNAADFGLEYTDSLAPPIVWQPVTGGITTNGATICAAVTAVPETPTRFYRLNLP